MQNLQDIALNEVDFFSRDILAAPLEFLKRLRHESPVFAARQTSHSRVQYLVTTYELVQYVLQNSALFSSDYVHILSGGGASDPEVEAIRSQGFEEVPSLLTADDRAHKRMRGLVGAAFTPVRIKAMSEQLHHVVNDLLNQFSARGECDFSNEFAAALPTRALATIMDFSPERYNDVTRWGAAIARRFGQMGSLQERIEDEKAILEAKRHIVELISLRRQSPGADLISDLVAAQMSGEEPLSELEILSTIFILLVGGTETTFATLNWCAYHLLKNPAVLEAVSSDEALVPLFIEEILRFYTPVAAFWRIARTDVELAGVLIPRGSVLMVRVDSANRDEAMFSNPDVFDIHRRNNARHLSFGGGVHACIGFRLGKMELNHSIPAILSRLRRLRINELQSDLSVVPSTHARNLHRLYINFSPEVAQQ